MASLPRVLVVGAGLTGAAVTHFLQSVTAPLSLSVWERNLFAGGRMQSMSLARAQGQSQAESATLSSSSSSSSTPPSSIPSSLPLCDMGAQYLTKSPSDSYDDVYSHLLSTGVIGPLDATTIEGMRSDQLSKLHYISTRGGLGSVVESFLPLPSSTSTSITPNVVPIMHGVHLEGLFLSVDGHSWLAEGTDSVNGKTVNEEFDAVILTLPTPQLLQLGGDFKNTLLQKNPDVLSAIEKVEYSSRFALAAFYAPLPSIMGALNVIPWTAKYVFDDDVIRYVSIESRKRPSVATPVASGTSTEMHGDHPSSEMISILIHTSVPFGIANKQTDQKAIENEILQHLENIIPGLGQPLACKLVHWEQSQVSRNSMGSVLGDATVFVGDKRLNSGLSEQEVCSFVKDDKDDSSSHSKSKAILALAGDAFTESNFEGCLRSAKACARIVSASLQAIKQAGGK